MISAAAIDGFTVRPLEDRDAAPLQALFDEDREFFQDITEADPAARRMRRTLVLEHTL